MKKLLVLLSAILVFASCDSAEREKAVVEGEISFSLDGQPFEFIKYDENSSSGNDPFGAAVCQIFTQNSITVTQVFGKRFEGNTIEEIVVSVPYQETGSWSESFYDVNLGIGNLPRYLFISAAFNNQYARADYSYRNEGGKFNIETTYYDEAEGRISGTFEATLLLHEKDQEGNWVLPAGEISFIVLTRGSFNVKIYSL